MTTQKDQVVRRRLLRFAILAVAGVAPLTLAVPAWAATGVSRSGGVITIDARDNRANDIRVERSGSAFHIRDTGDRPMAGPGCVQWLADVVVCPANGVTGIRIFAKDGPDRVVNDTGTRSAQYGGPGNDRLRGGSGVDALHGQAGNDTLTGGHGNDGLTGGAGDDTAVALGELDGRDRFTGGPGFDTTTYAARSRPVTVSLDGAENDGLPSERDNNRADVERVLGGRGGDTLVGNSGRNELRGNGGNDTLRGNAGRDTLDSRDGVFGNDRSYGGAGRDTCRSDLVDVRNSCELR